MTSWWHSSPGYVSIDAQPLKRAFQQPIRLFQKCHDFGSLLGYLVLIGPLCELARKKFANRENL